ncbi:MAG TPA: hypothetical protein VGM91_01470 [Conexibacter sp.]|jgi:hypothetical protein
MAAIGSSNPSAKQANAAAKVAGFKAEQVRLKKEAAERREAAAARAARGGTPPSARPWASGHGGGRPAARTGRQGQR